MNIKVNVKLDTLLTVIFVILKLTGIIDWSWIWVISPMWISIGSGFLIIGAIVLKDVIKSYLNLNKSNNLYDKEFVKTKSNLNSKQIKNKLNDKRFSDITQSLVLETDDKAEVLRQLKEARREIIEADKLSKEKKATESATMMVDDIACNLDMSAKERKSLLSSYRRVFENQTIKTMRPINKTLKLMKK